MAVVILVAAMALDTRVVRIGSPAAGAPGAFSAATYGTEALPKIRDAIEARAVDAAVLAEALGKDCAAAIKQYSVDAAGASVIAVKFTGVVGKEDSGVDDVAVPNLSPAITIRVQTGPAIMGTDLRDAPGTIKFGQFTNQIEYQNAGAAINKEMKKQVLSKLDTSAGRQDDQRRRRFPLVGNRYVAGHARKARRQVSAAAVPGEAVLTARDIVKTYGPIQALRGVNFDIHRGKVTTLFGENGAGKSTLMKILSGVVRPTSGLITLDGQEVSFDSAADARDCGISIIHQELSLAPNLSVRDNIFMGRELPGPAGIDYAEEARQTRLLMTDLEEEIDPLTPVENLRLGQQQIVEIARALSIDSRILIMDEPTSALSASEVEVLFKVIRDLTSRGVSIVYISHHLEEALQITDYAVVLRDGAITATAEARDIDLEWIVRNMVGDNFDLGSPPSGHAFGEVALSIEAVSVAGTAGANDLAVDRLSLAVRAGEIVCIYGLMGAGRTELLECVAGRVPTSGGQVYLEGQDVSRLNIAERIEAGLALVPEDRQRDGLVQTMTVGRNLSLPSIRDIARRVLLSTPRERTMVDQSIRNVHIKTAGPAVPIGSLSGGNQQKVVIGKMLVTHPKVILLDEPSRGIDIGAKAEVFRLLAERAKQGLAVVFSTSEVAECLSIAHRVVVMRRGQISAEFGVGVTKEGIMAASGESVVVH